MELRLHTPAMLQDPVLYKSSVQPQRNLFSKPYWNHFTVFQPKVLVRTSQSTPNTAHLGASWQDGTRYKGTFKGPIRVPLRFRVGAISNGLNLLIVPGCWPAFL